MQKKLQILGYASGIAGADPSSGHGPIILKQSSAMSVLSSYGLTLTWQCMLQPPDQINDVTETVGMLCQDLSNETAQLVHSNQNFIVLGGDHTSAIGTWSGVARALSHTGSIGLIWIDAHMDSHTPATSETGHLHGMPLACLLGYGDPRLTTLAGLSPALRPENVCLVGVRSYERGEATLLNKLGVRIFFMEEIRQRGLKSVLSEAKQIVSRNTVRYGVTLDIDSIDPEDAPGTGVSELNGIRSLDLCHAMTLFVDDPKLIGLEIVEFDPSRDQNHKTEKLIAELIAAATLGQ